MVPLHLSEEKSFHLASLLGCKIGSLPFTYLGMPLGLSKPSVQDYMPLVKNVRKEY
jgi:hypothetical protein